MVLLTHGRAKNIVIVCAVESIIGGPAPQNLKSRLYREKRTHSPSMSKRLTKEIRILIWVLFLNALSF